MTKVHELEKLGQSIWYDNIRRALLDSGELAALIQAGVSGVTSNPSIFEKAIAGSTDYDEALHRLVDEGKSAEEIYETLALDDIARTAESLRPVFNRSDGLDGYVSIEVSPKLANDTAATIAEAQRLYGALDRPNVMIKVPATPAGVPALRALIGAGINVNVTLIFSLQNYEQVAEAYLSGLEDLIAAGGDPSTVASVASFFVSRIDSKVDQILSGIGAEAARASALKGKIAVASAKVAYARFKELFGGPRWIELQNRGARVQRPLWASTSTKNPAYPDTLYVDSLIGAHTVNTIPPSTLNAFLDHGTVESTLEAGLEASLALLDEFRALGVDLGVVTQDLQQEGVAAFAESFTLLMTSIAEKRDRLLAGWEHASAALGEHKAAVETAIDEMAASRVLARIWARDHTVWKSEPTEITNRLGWLHTAEAMGENLIRFEALVRAVRNDRYTHAVLLGMGGSSLAPEMFRETFGVRDGFLDLAVLDSTDPGAVAALEARIDLSRTLFIVATKSGGTVETLSFFKYFYNRTLEAMGAGRAGEHFVAITDPGSRLTDLADRFQFRTIYLNDPNIGGRYSALSYFGLVPAALIGVDIPRLLDRALVSSCACESCVEAAGNPGAWLGAVLGEFSKAGRDKLTLLLSPQIDSFGDWVEQLIAESTGKEGKGIVPIVGEPTADPESYGPDRLFVQLQLDGDDSHDDLLAGLERAGRPVVRFRLHDAYDLGGQIFLWEMATAVAGRRLGLNPFDQPNVEAAKALARDMVAAYHERGPLPEEVPTAEADGLAIYSGLPYGGEGEQDTGVSEILRGFLGQAEPGSYLALQAYLQPDPDTDAALGALRTRLRDRTSLATTLGYGPRFLHSTGQLHKGDAGKGLFLQLTASDSHDLDIPDEAGAAESSMTFGVLKAAQAIGDRRALSEAGRSVVRVHLGDDVLDGLRRLMEALDNG